MYADILFDNNMVDKAIVEYQILKEEYDKDEEVFYKLAECYYQKGKVSKAEDYFETS